MRALTRAFGRNYSKCMVRLNTQTEFAVNIFQKSVAFFYSVSKPKKTVKERERIISFVKNEYVLTTRRRMDMKEEEDLHVEIEVV